MAQCTTPIRRGDRGGCLEPAAVTCRDFRRALREANDQMTDRNGGSPSREPTTMAIRSCCQSSSMAAFDPVPGTSPNRANYSDPVFDSSTWMELWVDRSWGGRGGPDGEAESTRMFLHLILGLLRDGKARHGYKLISEYKVHSGNLTHPGNFYRELAKLASEGLVESGLNQPNADPRQIPYQITDTGRAEFDRWLRSPSTPDEELSGWLLFADLLPPDVLNASLSRLEEQLWLLTKSLARARADAAEAARLNGSEGRYNPALALLLRRLKQVTAELEFLEEFRRETAAILSAGRLSSSSSGQSREEKPPEVRPKK